MIPLKLNEYFPGWKTGGGIFSAIVGNTGYSPPWTVPPNYLDLQYHGNYSGQKIGSPLVDNMAAGSPLTETDRETLAECIISIYRKNWEKLYATMQLEYNPIHNYDMTENETISGTTSTKTENSGKTAGTVQHGMIESGTDNTSITDKVETDQTVTASNNSTENLTHNLTSTRTPNLKESETATPATTVTATETPGETITTNSTATAQQDNSIFGFDSTTGAKSDTQSGNNTVQSSEAHSGTNKTITATTGTNTRTTDTTGTETTVDAGTDEKTITGGGTTGTKGTITTTGTHGTTTTRNSNGTDTESSEMSNSGYQSGEHGETRTLTRSGNVGVTTSQQMAQSERDLWVWRFFDQVFSDIDSVLTSPIF